MFLRHPEFSRTITEGGNRELVADYIDRVAGEVSNLTEAQLKVELDVILHSDLYAVDKAYYNDNSIIRVSKLDRAKQIVTSYRIRNEILKQRLYLNVLARESMFSPSLKTEVWRNIARLKPALVAAMVPNQRNEIMRRHGVSWDQLKDVLWDMQEARVRHEMNVARGGVLAPPPERNEILTHAPANLDPRMQSAIQELIVLGEGKAGELSKVFMPYNIGLDDASAAN